MNLITTKYFDYLAPSDEKYVAYYSNYLDTYTKAVVSTLVSQCNLMPEMFEETEQQLDSNIDSFIDNIPNLADDVQSEYKIMCLGAMLDPGKVIQENEPRSFVNDSFYDLARRKGISSRELVIKTLNSYAFLNYFSLIEDSLRNAYLSGDTKIIEGNLSGKKAISFCLNEKLKRDKTKNKFINELRVRSKLIKNYNSLQALWDWLNFIRNQQVHFNGKYDECAKEKYKEFTEKFFVSKRDDQLLIENVMFLDSIENIGESMFQSGELVIDETLENIVRNLGRFIMESLYVIEKTPPKIVEE